MKKHVKHTATDSGFVEVMTTRETGAVFGYRLVGTQSGPHIAIAGNPEPAVDAGQSGADPA